jgi:hypothetical protein
MDSSTRSPRPMAAAIAALLLALSACTGNAPIPSGAQRVEITLTDSGVVLEPDTVPAGDVYLILDDGAINFIERKAGPYASNEPLSDEQIARVRDGNLQDTSTSGLEANTCDPEQRAAARGMTGPCGNVMLVQVRPGSYLIVAGPPEQPGQPSAVLAVTP